MNLRWDYDNVQIKERDKQKVAFTTPERSFKPIVMFFGLTNSPATFQTMMNKILQDLINTGKVVSFINDVIISTEMEKEHNKLVEELVRRLAKNNLYVKPEKCKQKVREVGFLEVMIRPEGIQIKEDNVKGVLDWLISKCVKNVQKFLGLVNYYH